jgi:pimeloyl-ACP methyl ester carboxylesterase
MRRSAFTLQPRDGDVIRGDVRRPEDSGATGPGIDSAVVVVHGFKGFKDWGFFPHAAGRLADAGHTVVTFNFSRNGVGEDLQNFSELERFATNTLTLELEELRLILDQVFDGTLLGAPPQRVGLLGHSRGGGTSVIAAAEDGRVSSLTTWAAISSFDRWDEETKEKWRRDGRIWIPNARTKQEMPLNVTLLRDFEEHRDRLDILGAAARLEVPWLVVHGAADTTVSLDDGLALAAAGPEAELLRIDGAGHTFEARHPFQGSPPELTEALEATTNHFHRTLST